MRLAGTIGLLAMLCSLSFVSCASKPKSVLIGAATVQCQSECVSVSKAYVKEHADLFDEVIRLKASLKICTEKH